MNILRNIRSLAFAGFVLAWMGVIGATIPFLALAGNAARVRRVARLWCRGMLLGLRALCGLGWREEGRGDAIAAPVIYACNHQSYWEAIAFCVLVPDAAIVLKASLLRIPLAGWFLRRSPMIAVDRAGGAAALRETTRAARRCVAAGRSVVIFPEGTFQEGAGRRSFKGGVTGLYRALGLPVVPVAVDSGRFWPGHDRRIRPGTVTVSFLAAIPPGLPTDTFRERLETAIYDERDRLMAAAARQVPDGRRDGP